MKATFKSLVLAAVLAIFTCSNMHAYINQNYDFEAPRHDFKCNYVEFEDSLYYFEYRIDRSDYTMVVYVDKRYDEDKITISFGDYNYNNLYYGDYSDIRIHLNNDEDYSALNKLLDEVKDYLKHNNYKLKTIKSKSRVYDIFFFIQEHNNPDNVTPY